MTEALNVKPKESCRWDVVSLGEVMLASTRRAPFGCGRAAASTTSRAA